MTNRRISHQHLPENIELISVVGYLDKEAGQELFDVGTNLPPSGPQVFALDFTDCPIISSPGMTALLKLTCHICEDRNGRCFLLGLDKSKREFMEMTGVLDLAEQADSLDQVRKLLQTG